MTACRWRCEGLCDVRHIRFLIPYFSDGGGGANWPPCPVVVCAPPGRSSGLCGTAPPNHVMSPTTATSDITTVMMMPACWLLLPSSYRSRGEVAPCDSG